MNANFKNAPDGNGKKSSRKLLPLLSSKDRKALHTPSQKQCNPISSARIFVITIAVGLILSGCNNAKAEIFDPNHAIYNGLLKDFVKDGLINYAGLKQNPGRLNQYLENLSRISKDEFTSWNENEQLAYLINLYNAATLKLIIDHYPVDSIKDIGWFLKGPWDQKFVELFGDTITLKTLEHEIIRKDYDEPRIHMALVCAAMGCPTLRKEPYVGEKLEAQLDEDAKKFLNNKKGLQIDRREKTVSLTSIFKWFGEDFVNKYAPKSGFEGFNKTEQAVLNFSSRYLPEEEQAYLRVGKYSIKYLDYDWSLNERQVKND
jgi:hypothetical protein